MSDPKKEEREARMRRELSRRRLLTDEFGKASVEAIKRLPTLAPFLKVAMRENPAQREERLVRNLWQLLMGRLPKPDELNASMEAMRSAKLPDEKGDALVDVAWALCQTKEFEELNRPDSLLVRGFYKIALDREPTDTERETAAGILAEAEQAAEKGAALEGLLTALVRSWEFVLRRSEK
jgi:hypothetical protein